MKAVRKHHLSDGEISSIAALFAARAIPILFHCANFPPHLDARHPKAPVCIKPTDSSSIVGQIAFLLGQRGG
jgi:hypothetical protein